MFSKIVGNNSISDKEYLETILLDHLHLEFFLSTYCYQHVFENSSYYFGVSFSK